MYYIGIDILKIIAMMLITIHHIILHGGVIASSEGLAYNLVMLLEVICFCGVNCYAIISGFLGYGKKHSFSRYLKIWLQVVFYSVGSSLIFMILGYATIGDVIKAFLPVASYQYWYFSAYSVLCIFMPIIDRLVERTERKHLRRISIISGLFVLYISFVARVYDPFRVTGGHSPAWLSFLYFIGAIIRKYNLHEKIEKKKVSLGVGILLLITCIWQKYIGELVGHGYENVLLSDISPTIFGVAVGLVLVFAGLKCKSRLIPHIASSTFGVYLFHDSNSFRSYVMMDRFIFIGQMNLVLIIPTIVACAAVLFFCGVIIDQIRKLIFKVLRVNDFCKRVELRIGSLL